MDVQINIDNEKEVFTSGDYISGKINLVCASQKSTISELTATLIGESTSSLTGAPGLLFSRREDEKHTIIREQHRIIPFSMVSNPQKARPIRLDVGCHSFDFRMRIPWVPDCSTCPPNSPVEDEFYHDLISERPKSVRQLPPSTKDLHSGNAVAYRIDVVVTTIRNMFRSRTLKSYPITVWPPDARLARRDCAAKSIAATIEARATILGPSSLQLSSCVLLEEVLGLAPAEILISATFQPEFQLARLPSVTGRSPRSREVDMDLSVTKLNQHSQDLYLQSFQMLLVGYTDVRAGAASHGHMSFWTLQSLSNIGLQLFSASDPPGAQEKIDSRLWDSVTLDDSVVPDFVACNLERRYELEILMGWQCQSGEHAGRVFFVQARTPVRITSGIWPTEQTGKASLLESETYSQITPDFKKLWTLADEQSQRAYTRLSAPPTYDEAVSAAINDGLGKSTGGW